MDIILDFDGTCVTHDYPLTGKDIGAEPVLQRLIENGHRIILFTMRSNRENEPPFLDYALEWFYERKIVLYGVQKNPEQHRWTDSPKAYGQIIIDDAALGCPLVFDEQLSDRPFVDWEAVENILDYRGFFRNP